MNPALSRQRTCAIRFTAAVATIGDDDGSAASHLDTIKLQDVVVFKFVTIEPTVVLMSSSRPVPLPCYSAGIYLFSYRDFYFESLGLSLLYDKKLIQPLIS
jgi:hypothetical protein